jgi:hypothetical protein
MPQPQPLSRRGDPAAPLRAAMRWCWALPLAGAQQLLELGGAGGAERAAAGLEELTRAAQLQVGDVAGSLFESADQAQREAVDRLFDLLQPAGEAGRKAWRDDLAWLAGAAAAGRHLLPGRESAMAWLELRNKLAAYWRVRGTGGRAAAGAAAGDWRAAVEAALRREPSAAIFALEGLGHDLAEASFAEARGAGKSASAAPRALLSGRAAGLPERSLILLHAGMGMAFAQRACRELWARSPQPAVDAALAALVELCRDNAEPAYLAASLEPLGLVVRTFHPRLAAPVDRGLRRLGGEAVRWFWHGAGRAIYFLPLHGFPGATKAAAALCRREAPDGPALLDALDGMFYAAAMTNLEDPGVLAALAAEVGERQPEAEALADGFAAALLARFDTTPADPAIPALLAYRPGGGAARQALWEKQVAAPCRDALERLYPLLRARRELGLLARHRRLRELADELGGKDGRSAGAAPAGARTVAA